MQARNTMQGKKTGAKRPVFDVKFDVNEEIPKYNFGVIVCVRDARSNPRPCQDSRV